MKIGAGEKIQIARFLSFLLRGEQLAQACAADQAQLTQNRMMQRFLAGQSRQEAIHAHAFKAGILWLAPKGVNCPALAEINQYESMLTDALKNRNLPETLLGMQVLLEGMGSVVLNHFNQSIEARGIRFTRMRRAFLMQEASHHAFGIARLEGVINKPEYSTSQLSARASEYIGLIHDMLNKLDGLFEYFNEDSEEYIEEFHQELPQWESMRLS